MRVDLGRGDAGAGQVLTLKATRAGAAGLYAGAARASRTGRVRIPVFCYAARGERCRGRLRLAAAIDGRRHTAASARFSVPGRQSKPISVRLTARAQRVLDHEGLLITRATATSTIPVGLATTRDRRITIRSAQPADRPPAFTGNAQR